MGILRIRGARLELQLQGVGGARRPLVTNYQVIIAARLMSEVNVITPHGKRFAAAVAALLLKAFNSETPEFADFCTNYLRMKFKRLKEKERESGLMPVALSWSQLTWRAQVVLGAPL